MVSHLLRLLIIDILATCAASGTPESGIASWSAVFP